MCFLRFRQFSLNLKHLLHQLLCLFFLHPPKADHFAKQLNFSLLLENLSFKLTVIFLLQLDFSRCLLNAFVSKFSDFILKTISFVYDCLVALDGFESCHYLGLVKLGRSDKQPELGSFLTGAQISQIGTGVNDYLENVAKILVNIFLSIWLCPFLPRC